MSYKKRYLLLLLCLICYSSLVQAQIWSNEIHYQNTGADLNEKIELAGLAGTSLSGWSVAFYDGSSGTVYATATLSGSLSSANCTVNSQGIGLYVIDVLAVTGFTFQNAGALPDGWALVNGATVVEFLSYDGTFTAVSGPAAGNTSVNIGTNEPFNCSATSSIQRTGATTWVFADGTNTFNACNTTQYNPNAPQPPASNAGPDREISLGSTVTLAAIATNGTGSWSVFSGPSTSNTQFSSLTAANAVFTPAGGVGTYTLRWSVTNGSSTATDDVNILVDPLPPPANQQIFSNEIHYQNVGADINEKIELAGPAGTSLTGWKILFYEGTTGTVYATAILSGTLPNSCTVGGVNIGVVVVDVVAATGFSLGNGSGGPDGWALVFGATPVEFLSYSGTFTATNGFASGMTSVDINATEPASTAATSSIQRTATTTWVFAEGTNTFGACNSTQYNPNGPLPPASNAGPDREISVAGTATMAAIATNGTGVWSVVSGPSTANSQFSSTAAANAVFTPAGGTGTYVLRWTVSAAGFPNATDDANVVVDPLPPSVCQQIFSNEIHYQNVGTDINEKIELAGPAGTSLTGWKIQFYEGTTGTVYATAILSGTLPNTCTVSGVNMGVVVVDVVAATGFALGNGVGGDGWALVFGATPVEFFSYGGIFTATNGFASGMTSTNIVATEPASTSANSSIQRSGMSTWVFAEGTNTFNACNTNQNFCPEPVANAGPNQSRCIGATATLAATAFNGTGVWSIVSGPSTATSQFSSLSAANAIFTPAGGVGTYTLRWTVSAAGYPDDTDDVDIIINPLPTAAIAGELVICPGGSRVLTASGGGTYLWSTTATTAAITVSAAGTYTVIVTSAAGCTNSATATTRILSAGTISAIPNNPTGIGIGFGVCFGSTLALSSNGEPGGVWVPSFKPIPVVAVSATGIVTPLLATPSDDTSTVYYRVTATGCTIGAATTVNVLGQNPGTISGSTNICTGNSSTLSSNGATGGTWSSSNMAVATVSSTGLVSGLTPGMSTITYTVTQSGCSSTTTAVVTITTCCALPDAICKPANAILIGNSVTITTAAVDNGSTAACGLQSSTVTPNTFNCSHVGTPQTVTLTVTDINGASDQCQATVTVLDMTPPTITCPANTTVAANGTCSGTVGTRVLASKSDNCATVISETQSPAASTILTGHNAAQTVTLTANDGNGNTATCSFTVTLKDITPPTIACPANATVAADGTCSGTVGARVLASKSDNCATVISETQSPAASTILTGHNAAQTVTLTANDGNGNTATCSFTVTLKDITPPTITCPANATVAADGTCSGTVGTRVLASKSDNCATVISETQSPAASTILTGHNAAQTVTLTANDGNGNTATCSFTVTLKDITPPTITCPANATVAADGTCSGTVGARVLASKSDNCATVISETQSPAASTVLTGHNTAQTVTLTANDGNGNTATCSFTVTLKDITPPTISCPANATIAADGTCSGTVGTRVLASKSDNCATVITETQSPAASTILTGHNTAQTVTLTANDGNGNTATCSFTVTLKDITPPTIACPANATVAADGTCSGTVGARVLASKSDNCATVISETQSPAASTVLTGHNTAQTVTLTANDGNSNTATCSFTVTLKDITPPTISCPANATVAADGTCSGTVGTRVLASKSDNCATVITETQSPAASTILTGHNAAQTVTLTANDGNGNTATCSFTVTLKDITPPTIACPANATVAADGTCSGTVGARVLVSKSDNCATVITETQSPAASTVLTGHNAAQTVTLTANDGNGNTATCAFTVTLKDITPPTITCPANATVAADGTCSGVIGTRVLVSKSDNCATVITEAQSPAASTILTGHNTAQTVTLTANDGNGNTATCSFTVTLKDITPPTIACPANTTLAANASCTGVIGTRVLVSKSDNCATVITETQSPAASATISGHNTVQTVVLTANDGNGNTATCSFTVTLKDITPPTIACPPNATVAADANCSGAIGPRVLASKSDNCATIITETQSPAASTILTGHNTAQTVTLTANDGNGNTATCAFTVTLKDITKPVVVCKPFTTYLSVTGVASIVPSNVFLSGTDNCGSVIIQSAAPTAFDCSNIGANTVTLVVNDDHGNTASCTSTVTVVDNFVPSVQCPDNLSITSTDFDCSATVNYTVTTQDNCGIATIDYSNAPGTVFEGGSTLVEVTAYDFGGNSAECSFWVFVQSAKEVCDGEDNDCDGLVDEADNFIQISKQFDAASGQFDQYGNAVAIDHSTSIVGVQLDDEKGFNAGAAQIYERTDNGEWFVTKRLYANDASSDDQFGHAVAVHGDWALVAANLRDDGGINTGAVYVFGRNAGGANQWGQVGKLLPADPGSNQNFGAALSFDGRFVLVGADLDDQQANNAGAAYIFDAQNAWAQVAKLTAGDGLSDDAFGAAVAIDNQEFALIGAAGNDALGDQAGAAYLYRRIAADGSWVLVKKLTAATTAAGDRMGFSVALSGVSAVVGAPRNDFRKPNGGLAYVFDRNAGGINNWGESSKLFAYDAETGDQLGRSVAVEGALAVVGTPYENAKGSGAGSFYTYIRQDDGVWVFSEKIVDPTGNLDDNLCAVMALSQRTILAGAPRDDIDNVSDRGTAQWFESRCTPVDINLTQPETGLTKFVDQQIKASGTALRTYPVPFGTVLQVEINLPVAAADAKITISNALGQVVARLYDGALGEGVHQLQWVPASTVPAGTYILRVDAGAVQEVRNIIRVQE